MTPYYFSALALWPLVCCGENCPRTPICIVCSAAVAAGAVLLALLVRELWLLKTFRGYP